MSFLIDEFNKLSKNKEQLEAFLCNSNSVLLAGPGSGKTATLTLKIIKLLDGISEPRGLACITFNNEAVREFNNRLKKLGYKQRINVFLGTVHSFCLSSILIPFGNLSNLGLKYPISVISEESKNLYIAKARDLTGFKDYPYFISDFDKYRRTHISKKDKNWRDNPELSKVIEVYEKMIFEKGFVDFDSIISLSLIIVTENPIARKCLSAKYPWILIDEYQDLGFPLHKIITTLIENTDIKIFAVGDPYQSIYSFTGADPKYLLELSRRNDVSCVELKLNYRCGQKIIDGAEIVLSPPVPNNYISTRQDNLGEINFIEKLPDIEAQANTICKDILPKLLLAGYSPEKIAVLYIDKNDAKIITNILEMNHVPYSGEKDQRYERTILTRWIEDIAKWCCDDDNISFNDLFYYWRNILFDTGIILSEDVYLLKLSKFFRIIFDLKDKNIKLIDWLHRLDTKLSLRERLKIAKSGFDQIKSLESVFKACENNGPLFDFTLANFAECGKSLNKISLNTLHSSKGLQFDVVIMPGIEEGRLPNWRANSPQQIQESRRIFYVGITRARYLVYILYSGQYKTEKFGLVKKGPSTLAIELQNKLQ